MISHEDYTEEQENGVWHYIDNSVRGIYTEEEIEAMNKEDIERQNEALKRIEADGFIKFPVFAYNNFGEMVEKFAYVHPDFTPSCTEGFEEKHGMKYNIYIPSYKRAKNTLTVRALVSNNVENYYLAIDPDQYVDYVEYHDPKHLIIRDWSFREDDMVELCSSVRVPQRMVGHSPLTNWCLQFSRSLGEKKYWFMDDDVICLAMKAFRGDHKAPHDIVYNKENYHRCSNLTPQYGFSIQKFFSGLEDIMDKTRNPGFCGLEKFGMVFHLPIMWKTGTRVYTVYLSNNETQPKHIGRQNNDVITSIQNSKFGMVNQLFEGFCYSSAPTQMGAGGQSDMYKTLGTFDKGKVLVQTCPNSAKYTYRHCRIHHVCDYTFYSSGKGKDGQGLRPVGAVKG